jgi:diketogulonate reductase-like aldo/keto reductase
MAQGFIPIPGTTKTERLEENWAARDITFTDKELKELRQFVDAAKPQGNR